MALSLALAPQLGPSETLSDGPSNSASRHRQGDRRDRGLHPSQIAEDARPPS